MVGTQEYGTFSQLIDETIAKAGRGLAARSSLVAYARSTMRECQLQAMFEKDRVEDQITATATPHIWTRPKSFRMMETVYYPAIGVFPHFKGPGRRQKSDHEYIYYAASNYYIFPDVENGDLIDLSYFNYFTPLVYFEQAERPARYFADLGEWQYLDGNGDYVLTLGTDALDEAARDLVSNWLLFDYYDVIVEGTLAKIFKTNADQRAVSSFALYKSYQNNVLQGEPYASLNV